MFSLEGSLFSGLAAAVSVEELHHHLHFQPKDGNISLIPVALYLGPASPG